MLPMLVFWIGFIILIAILLALDLGIFNRKRHAPTIKEALTWTGVWVFISLLFCLFVWLEFGHDAGLAFLGGYLLEKSLSVDNIFVIFLIFTSFQIDAKYQHKILFYGIIGAIILRGILIGIGSALVTRFEWIFYIFGAFLLYSSIKLLIKREEEYDPHKGWIVRTIHKFWPVTRNRKDGRFFVGSAITIMFVALLVIEFTDVVFAFDSIPAIFGITTNVFIVFTSNIFAILGLRSLYFVVARLHDMFEYLNYGLAFILFFIGAKMLLMKFVEISLVTSLTIVFLALTISITASVLHKRQLDKA